MVQIYGEILRRMTNHMAHHYNDESNDGSFYGDNFLSLLTKYNKEDEIVDKALMKLVDEYLYLSYKRICEGDIVGSRKILDMLMNIVRVHGCSSSLPLLRFSIIRMQALIYYYAREWSALIGLMDGAMAELRKTSISNPSSPIPSSSYSHSFDQYHQQHRYGQTTETCLVDALLMLAEAYDSTGRRCVTDAISILHRHMDNSNENDNVHKKNHDDNKENVNMTSSVTATRTITGSVTGDITGTVTGTVTGTTIPCPLLGPTLPIPCCLAVGYYLLGSLLNVNGDAAGAVPYLAGAVKWAKSLQLLDVMKELKWALEDIEKRMHSSPDNTNTNGQSGKPRSSSRSRHANRDRSPSPSKSPPQSQSQSPLLAVRLPTAAVTQKAKTTLLGRHSKSNISNSNISNSNLRGSSGAADVETSDHLASRGPKELIRERRLLQRSKSADASRRPVPVESSSSSSSCNIIGIGIGIGVHRAPHPPNSIPQSAFSPIVSHSMSHNMSTAMLDDSHTVVDVVSATGDRGTRSGSAGRDHSTFPDSTLRSRTTAWPVPSVSPPSLSVAVDSVVPVPVSVSPQSSFVGTDREGGVNVCTQTAVATSETHAATSVQRHVRGWLCRRSGTEIGTGTGTLDSIRTLNASLASTTALTAAWRQLAEEQAVLRAERAGTEALRGLSQMTVFREAILAEAHLQKEVRRLSECVGLGDEDARQLQSQNFRLRHQVRSEVGNKEQLEAIVVDLRRDKDELFLVQTELHREISKLQGEISHMGELELSCSQFQQRIESQERLINDIQEENRSLSETKQAMLELARMSSEDEACRHIDLAQRWQRERIALQDEIQSSRLALEQHKVEHSVLQHRLFDSQHSCQLLKERALLAEEREAKAVAVINAQQRLLEQVATRELKVATAVRESRISKELKFIRDQLTSLNSPPEKRRYNNEQKKERKSMMMMTTTMGQSATTTPTSVNVGVFDGITTPHLVPDGDHTGSPQTQSQTQTQERQRRVSRKKTTTTSPVRQGGDGDVDEGTQRSPDLYRYSQQQQSPSRPRPSGNTEEMKSVARPLWRFTM
eukprot:gene7335-14972_t